MVTKKLQPLERKTSSRAKTPTAPPAKALPRTQSAKRVAEMEKMAKTAPKLEDLPPVKITVSRGLCSALRGDVLTGIGVTNTLKGPPWSGSDTRWGLAVLEVKAWAMGKWGTPYDGWNPLGDEDKWAKKHFVEITVSAAQAKYAERLLWQSGVCDLENNSLTGAPLNPTLDWSKAAVCTPEGHLPRGEAFKSWADNKVGGWKSNPFKRGK